MLHESSTPVVHSLNRDPARFILSESSPCLYLNMYAETYLYSTTHQSCDSLTDRDSLPWSLFSEERGERECLKIMESLDWDSQWQQ